MYNDFTTPPLESTVKLAAAVTLCLASSVAAASDWTVVAYNDNYRVEVQNGSVKFNKNRAGEFIVVATTRETTLRTNNASFYQRYVTVDDCDRGAGVFVALNLDGKFQSEHQFIFGGGTLASHAAEAICFVGEQMAKELSKKTNDKSI